MADLNISVNDQSNITESTTVHPSVRYWVGGTDTWNSTAGNKWSTTSGGAGGASAPTLYDDVYIDANSGSGTITMTGAVCRNLDCDGFTGTLTSATSLSSIYGNLRFSATMTLSGVQYIYFYGSGSHTITSNGKSRGGGYVFLGSGTYTLQDAFTTTWYVYLWGGTLDTNNQALTCYSFQSSTTSTRALTLGSSVFTVTGTAGWFTSTTTNFTFTPGTSTVKLTANADGVIFNPGGLTFNNLDLSGSSYSVLEIAGNCTVSGTFTMNGVSATSRRSLLSNDPNTQRTITAATVSISNCDFQSIVGAGAGTWSGTSIGNGGNNSGITTTTPVTRYLVLDNVYAESSIFSSTDDWSTTSGGAGGASVPLIHDTVVIDSLSFPSGGESFWLDRYVIPSMDFTNVTNNPTLVLSNGSKRIFGSLKLKSGMGQTGSSYTVRFQGTGTNTLDLNGLSWGYGDIYAHSPGTLQLGSNTTLPSTKYVYLSSGTIDINDYDLTTGYFSAVSNGFTKAFVGGSGTIILLGYGTPWYIASSVGLTFTPETSTIKFTNTSASSVTFTGAGLTYNNIWFSRGTSTGDNIIYSYSNTFNDFKDDGSEAHSIKFTAGTTQTVNTFTVSGSLGKQITINSNGSTATHTLTKAGGGTIERDYLNIQHSVATPANTWYAGFNSTDNQSVATAGSGWIFTDVPSASVSPSSSVSLSISPSSSVSPSASVSLSVSPSSSVSPSESISPSASTSPSSSVSASVSPSASISPSSSISPSASISPSSSASPSVESTSPSASVSPSASSSPSKSPSASASPSPEYLTYKVRTQSRPLGTTRIEVRTGRTRSRAIIGRID